MTQRSVSRTQDYALFTNLNTMMICSVDVFVCVDESS